VERRRLGPVARWLAVGFLALLMFASLLPQAGVVLAASARAGRSRPPVITPRPLQAGQRRDAQVHRQFAALFRLAVLICLAIGVRLAVDHGRTRTPGRGAMDALTHADPRDSGHRHRHRVHPCIPTSSAWDRVALTACGSSFRWFSPSAACRTTVRSSYSSLLLVHKSMEEAAENVGAGKLITFRDITAPLVWRASSSARFFPSSCRSRGVRHAVLTLGGWEMIPFGIFTYYNRRIPQPGGPLGVILDRLCAASLYVVNRVAGARVGGLFGEMRPLAELDARGVRAVLVDIDETLTTAAS